MEQRSWPVELLEGNFLIIFLVSSIVINGKSNLLEGFGMNLDSMSIGVIFDSVNFCPIDDILST